MAGCDNGIFSFFGGGGGARGQCQYKSKQRHGKLPTVLRRLVC